MGRKKGSWCGEANPRFNGGKYKAANGYVFVKSPNHPNADKRGYVREHVLVASLAIGRPIEKGEVVHHINGVKDDNRPENLEVMQQGKHLSLHHKGVQKPGSMANLRLMTSERAKAIWESGVRDHMRAKPHICEFCKTQFFGERHAGHAHVFCGRKCSTLFRIDKAKATKAQQSPSQ